MQLKQNAAKIQIEDMLDFSMDEDDVDEKLTIPNSESDATSSNSSVGCEIQEDRPFLCDICLRGFTVKGLLEQHRDRHRTKIRQHHCNKCGLQFLVTTHFKQHTCIQ